MHVTEKSIPTQRLAEMYKGQQDVSRGIFCCKMKPLYYFGFFLGNIGAGKNKRHIQVWWSAWVKSSWRQQRAILKLPNPRKAQDILRNKWSCYILATPCHEWERGLPERILLRPSLKDSFRLWLLSGLTCYQWTSSGDCFVIWGDLCTPPEESIMTLFGIFWEWSLQILV